jgi:hypothetical protein
VSMAPRARTGAFVASRKSRSVEAGCAPTCGCADARWARPQSSDCRTHLMARCAVWGARDGR